MLGERVAPGIKLGRSEIRTAQGPQPVEVRPASGDAGPVGRDGAELVGAVERGAGQVGRFDDGAASAEQVQLGVQAADAAHPAAGGENTTQRGNVADPRQSRRGYSGR